MDGFFVVILLSRESEGDVIHKTNPDSRLGVAFASKFSA